MQKRPSLRVALVGAASCALFAASVQAQDVIKIGVNGVMSGDAASWGLVNKYCA